MPGKKTGFKKPRGKKTKRGYRNYKKKNSIGPMIKLGNDYRSSEPFQAMRFAKVVYSDIGLLYSTAIGTSIGAELLLNANSLYDPDGRTGGHQPYGFDQLMTIYSYYRVYGVKAEITFTDPSSDGMFWAVTVGGNQLTGKFYNEIAECDDVATGFLNNTGSQVSKFVQYFPIHKIFNIPKTQYQNSISYEGTASANPALTTFVRAGVGRTASGVGGGTEQTIGVSWRMTYYAVFFDKKQLPQS